jgi:choline-sulfatase
MPTPPNILLIICDSARADAYEHSTGDDLGWIQTPVADRLAAEGVSFRRAFTPVGLCHPARACLDTGLHSHVNGQLVNTVWDKFNLTGVRDAAPSYLRQLQSAGYRVGYSGQRHLRQHFFNDVVPGAITGFKAAGLRETTHPDRPRRLPFYGELELPAHQHRDAFTVRGTQELLRRYAAQSQPWLIQCEYDGPHPPFYMPAEYANLYDPVSILRPTSFDDEGTGKPLMHSRARSRQMPEPWGEDWQRLIAHYGGYITMLDQFTGQVLEELDRLGQADNTIVIFTSDHGELVGAHGTVTKYPQMYDEVLRVPLIVRWPGHTTPGTVEASFVSHIDLLATLTELAGLPPPQETHGQSWASLAKGEPVPNPREVIYGQLSGWGNNAWYSLRMVRNAGWKYVYSPFVEEELYDLTADPKEINNIASLRPNQVAVMRALMAQEMQAVGDPLAGQPEFRPYLRS